MEVVAGKWTQIVRQNNEELPPRPPPPTTMTSSTLTSSSATQQQLNSTKIKTLTNVLMKKTPRQEAIDEESETVA